MPFIKGHKIWLGRHHTKEAREKMRLASIGIKHTKETRIQMSLSRKGRKHSIATIEKMSKIKEGHITTEETKMKIGLANRGKKLSSEHIEKIRKFNLGKTPWNKIGEGITTQNKLDRVRFHKTIQPVVLKRDNYTCQICLKKGGWLQVDHIKSWSNYSELRFEVNNCRTLCMSCHYRITFKREKPNQIIWGHNLTSKVGSSC